MVSCNIRCGREEQKEERKKAFPDIFSPDVPEA